MTDETISLDEHRGMAAQKAIDGRRLVAEVEANEKELRTRQDAATPWVDDPRRRKLIANVLEDFARLSAEA